MRNCDAPEAVVTIGVFDGVHTGHQALISQVVERAGELGISSGCVTFSPHPQEVLRPASAVAHLSTLDERLALIKGQGVDDVMLMEFTPSLAQLYPEDFIQLVLDRFQIRELWVGSDFALGRDRTGTPERLARIGQAEGFLVRPFSRVEALGSSVSSSRIRGLLQEGRVEEASQLLGRHYRLSGIVGEGDRRGRTLGFATANLTPTARLCVPKDGVYAVWGRSKAGHVHPGVTNVGVRPTFGGTERQIEVHLLDFEGDLYGDSLEVDFVARLRDELRFESVEKLIVQMKADVVETRRQLAASPASSV